MTSSDNSERLHQINDPSLLLNSSRIITTQTASTPLDIADEMVNEI